MSSTVAEAAEALRSGGLVVLPTDTVYGVGCLASDADAVDRLFRAKQRPRELELPVLVPAIEEAERLARLDERSRLLAREFWPGALTLVLPRSEESGPWSLGEERATIGLRVPAATLALDLLTVTGPLAVTSANRSGAPTLPTCEEVRAVFGTAVAVYLCNDGETGGDASTVVDLAGAEPRILREGDLAERVRALLRDER